MEVGAVKHQLNNEIIRMKKQLNQAKVQLIHKLTRKANTLKNGQKKAPELLKAKLQRKADVAVAEVLLIKKVKAKELIRFALSHKGSLQEHINKSDVDSEKVLAKILIHKAMANKYKSLRDIFTNMPIDELLMTRKERLQIKKAKQDTEKNKNSKKEKQKRLPNDVENGVSCDENDEEAFNDPDNQMNESDTNEEANESESDDSADKSEQNLDPSEISSNDSEEAGNDSEVDDTQLLIKEVPEIEKLASNKIVNKLAVKKIITKSALEKPAQKKDIKPKHKMKKPNKKPRKTSHVELEGQVPAQGKVVDSFFLTTSGDHYMTLAEPRAPDEVKEEHCRGNRRMRRAEKFGKPVKPFMNKKFKNNDLEYNNKAGSSKYEKPHLNYKKNDSLKVGDGFSRKEFDGPRSSKLSNISIDKRKAELETEKLHPSWEAKKQKSGIVQFQGKKVVF